MLRPYSAKLTQSARRVDRPGLFLYLVSFRNRVQAIA
jgi:hypothetical protein